MRLAQDLGVGDVKVATYKDAGVGRAKGDRNSKSSGHELGTNCWV